VVIVRNVQKMVLVIIPSIVQEWFRRSWRWLIAGIALMIMAAKIARITKIVQAWDEVLGRRSLAVPASWR
jgi:hypothetical protein